MINEYRVEKLKHVLAGLKRQGYKSYASIERGFEVSASYLSQIINGTVPFGELAARNIEEKLELPPFYLDRDDVFLEDEETSLFNIENTRDGENFHTDYAIRIHNKKDMKVIVYKQCKVLNKTDFEFVGKEREVEMTQKFFAKHDVKPSCFKIVINDSDSMKPYINKDDEVGVDLSRPNILDGELYLLIFGGEVMIKQVFREVGESLKLHSYNESYPDRVVSKSDLKIIGKVIYRAG